ECAPYDRPTDADAREISSIATTCATYPSPAPPQASSTVMPSRPMPPSFTHRSAGNTLSRSMSAARGAISPDANLRTDARSMSIVSPSSKSSEGKFSMCSPCAVSSIRLPVHDHQRLLHDRDQCAFPAPLRVDFAARDRERASGLDDESFRDHTLSLRRREQVQLVFDGQHRAVLGKQRVGRVS